MKQGWEIKKLGEVCEKCSSNISQNQLDNEVGGYQIFGASGLIKNVSFYHQDKPYLSIVKDGSGVGRVRKMDAYTSVIGTLQYILPKENIGLNYLYYNLISINFKKYIVGTAIPHIYFKDYKNEPILWMPLPEQQRIVAILDEAFAAIAKAKANAEQNLKNAKELFESYLQVVFESKGEGWEEKTLGEVCNIIGGGTPSKANSKFYDGDIYWATVRDMKGEVVFDTEHKITKEAVKNSSTNIIPKGNVIIATRVGLGKVCLVGNDTAINQDLRGVVPINSKTISVDFLYRWFKSISHKIVEEGTGATVQGVKLSFIKSLIIYLPSLIEQQTIAQKLDVLSAKTKKLEAIYQQKINDLEELKKSILQKAFAGEFIEPSSYQRKNS